MCTVSWLRQPAGYQFFFNRDERRTRAPESPPEVAILDDVRWLAPRDGDHHGTWIAANEYGIAIGLLNRWDQLVAENTPYTSRGALVASLMNLPSLDRLHDRLSREELTPFRPFELVAVAPGQDALLVSWDGRSVSVARQARSGLIAVSSGHDQAGAETARRALFTEPPGGWSAAGLIALHRSHLPERGALSPCMHRSDASTVSFTVVSVEDAIRMEYTPESPCVGMATSYLMDRRY